MYHVKAVITLRKSILDPQGKAVEHAIQSLGYENVEGVRIGKMIEFDIASEVMNDAEQTATTICTKLLANPVMEDFSLTLEKK